MEKFIDTSRGHFAIGEHVDAAEAKDSAIYERRGRYLSRSAIGFTAGMLAVSVLVGLNINRMNEERAMLELSDDVTDLRNPQSLDLRGACADELSAQATYYDYLSNNGQQLHRSGESFALRARRYTEAAALADKHDLDCKPARFYTKKITEDFDIAALKAEDMCADKLQDKVADPDTAPNGMYADIIEHQNIKFDLQAQLADEYDVDCS